MSNWNVALTSFPVYIRSCYSPVCSCASFVSLSSSCFCSELYSLFRSWQRRSRSANSRSPVTVQVSLHYSNVSPLLLLTTQPLKVTAYSSTRTLLLQIICPNYFPRQSSVLNILHILYWSLDVRESNRSGFRSFMIIHINAIVSTLRDCFRQNGMRPRGRREGFPHPHNVQITLSSASK
jgi:hypothetical protein